MNESKPDDARLINVAPAQPDPYRGYPSRQFMGYGAEKAELQRVLTKRNATIGRLRAANRELRRERATIRNAVGLWHESFIAGDEDEAAKRCDDVFSAAAEMVLGRDGLDEAGRLFDIATTGEVRAELNRDGPPGVESTVVYEQRQATPEPAFTGPLEVGSWYLAEDDCHYRCVQIQLSASGAIVALMSTNGFSVWYDLDGVSREVEEEWPRIIRKVDTPGGES